MTADGDVSTGVRILITGGASGLGLALAQAYLARGATVVVGDLASDRPDSVPDQAAYLRLDVRSQQDWDAALAWVKETWGGLDLLFNNAGIATGGRIDVESMADWERVIDINLLGVVRGCQTFTPLLKEQGAGHIVNTASLAAWSTVPACPATTPPRRVSWPCPRPCTSSWGRSGSACR